MNRELSSPSAVELAGRPTNGWAESLPIGSLPLSETETVLYSLANMIRQRDSHTAGHCERLAFSGSALGAAMGLDSESLLTLFVGGYLHDVGKVGIPDSILFKPGKLVDEEWSIMREHPVRGEAICRPIESLRPALPLIRFHHEKWDGTGYPDGLRGTAIPLLARVLQIVDIYDALTNPRPYKHAFSGSRALEILKEECKLGWRDPEISELFIRSEDRRLSAPDARTKTMPPGTVDSLRNLQVHLAQ